jgi:hypothetical protein
MKTKLKQENTTQIKGELGMKKMQQTGNSAGENGRNKRSGKKSNRSMDA